MSQLLLHSGSRVGGAGANPCRLKAKTQLRPGQVGSRKEAQPSITPVKNLELPSVDHLLVFVLWVETGKLGRNLCKQRENTQTPLIESNRLPSCCEATFSTTAPLCCPSYLTHCGENSPKQTLVVTLMFVGLFVVTPTVQMQGRK